MVSEILRQYYPGRRYITQLRVGPLPESVTGETLSEADKHFLRVYNRWADAAVLDGKTLVLIEAELKPKLGPVEALLIYRDLAPLTPELARWNYLDVRLELWYAVPDPALLGLARRFGIVTRQYIPPWWSEYAKLLRPRETRPPRM